MNKITKHKNHLVKRLISALRYRCWRERKYNCPQCHIEMYRAVKTESGECFRCLNCQGDFLVMYDPGLIIKKAIDLLNKRIYCAFCDTEIDVVSTSGNSESCSCTLCKAYFWRTKSPHDKSRYEYLQSHKSGYYCPFCEGPIAGRNNEDNKRESYTCLDCGCNGSIEYSFPRRGHTPYLFKVEIEGKEYIVTPEEHRELRKEGKLEKA